VNRDPAKAREWQARSRARAAARARERKPTRLAPRSAKRADEYARDGGRRDLVAATLAARPRCEARVLCRGARAVDVHERLTRARGGLILDLDQSHAITACRACHDWIGREPAAATAARLLLPSWHTCPPVGPC
jgi:hypothetical protein